MHSLEFEYEEPIEKRFEDLCQDLCIEGSIREEAWEKYKDVWANYSVDGDQLQWLVCSLYECCRRSISDSLAGHVVENAYVSLSRLLSAAKMSMVQFFHRIRKWADMTDMIDDMRDRVELLERQFAVSSVIFRNFGRSFGVLFHEPVFEDNSDNPTTADLFRLTWLLFIKSRANFPAVTDDLVNSYHLLACCLDWILGAVMVSRRSDMINLELTGLPKEFLTAVSQKNTWCPPHELPPCMLRLICEDNEVNYVECKTVKEHFFKPFIARLIEKDLIKLNPPLIYGSILEPDNFDITLQNLNNNYEEYIIGTGDFDERIYLTPNAAEEIGSASQSGVQSNLALSSDLAPSARRYMLELSNIGFGGFTETNRRGKANAGAVSRLNGGINFNNPEARNQNLNQLQILLAGRSKEPSAALVDLIQSHCSVSPLEEMQSHLDELAAEFQLMYVRADYLPSSTGSGSPDELALSAAQQRVYLGLQLYYLALESILMDEVRRMEKRMNACAGSAVIADGMNSQGRRVKPDLSGLLTQEIFHRSLFSCCMELVMISCDPPERHFPWILEALNLEALHFFKVIEVLVRNVDLPRDVVKYMNQVGELILDSYAWRSLSPLWAAIKAAGRAPSIEEVVPPERLEQSGFSRPGALPSEQLKTTASSTQNVMIRHGPTPSKQARLLASATSGSLIRSRPSGEHGSTVSTARHISTGAHVEDESAEATAQLLASGVGDIETDANSNLLSGPTEEVTLTEGVSALTKRGTAAAGATNVLNTNSGSWSRVNPGNAPMKFYPTRRDSLAIFFRQLYMIASVRLRDLCDRLNVQRDVLAKVWTCVEHAIVHETELLRDRCLDQIILCALYGVCKTMLYRQLTFIDIIQVYRMQPQSHRDIYRRVLINVVAYGINHGEDRGDLSRFYNVVFLPHMTQFLRKVTSTYNQSDTGDRGLTLASGGSTTDNLWSDQPSMAPLPVYPSLPPTMAGTVLGNVLNASSATGSAEVSQARRLASNRNVFISPVKQPSQQQLTISPKRVVFTIGRSSGKDLQDVNLMISSAERRASMANLTMNLKRPGPGSSSTGGYVTNSSAFSLSSSNSGPRTVTVVGPGSFGGKRFDFDL
ncbi:putative retinoblastoma protein [Fasciola gigantica]|uniref:Putative retinoblastoma protein n=1 Tax=Fasciola gigantica TaxID=46835 RepID=A0A504YXB4_FASGI|nr:putative retinoblastoma protein [Fasciola gigantica]